MPKITPEQMNEMNEKLQKDLEDCGGDYMSYLRKHNRHTLNISLTNEQTGRESWNGSSITFYNEDNAYSHLCLVEEFFKLLLKKENREWGHEHTSQEIVDRIINPIKDRLVGKMNTYQNDEDE